MKLVHFRAVALGSLLWAVPAMASEVPDELCSLHEVLDLVQQHYGQRSPGLSVIETTATVARTHGDRVVCAVQTRIPLYGSAAGTLAPGVLFEPRTFEVRPVNGGVVVDFGAR